MSEKGRVLGIGGIFFKSAGPDALSAWYQAQLGVPPGGVFRWRSHEPPEVEGCTVISVKPAASDYFEAPFMVNYIVDDLDALLAKLKAQGVRIHPKGVEDFPPYGRFAWVYDPDGNRIELWEAPAPA